jgi:hypothetical protein
MGCLFEIDGIKTNGIPPIMKLPPIIVRQPPVPTVTTPAIIMKEP